MTKPNARYWLAAGRVRISMMAVAVCTVLATPPAHAQQQDQKDPLGRLVWTQLAVGRWTGPGKGPAMGINTRVLYPDTAVPPELGAQQGPMTVGNVSLSPADGQPRLHPTLDHLGMGVMAGLGSGLTLQPGGQSGRGFVNTNGTVSLLRAKSDKSLEQVEVVGDGFFYPSITKDGRYAYVTKIAPSKEGISYQTFRADLVNSNPATLFMDHSAYATLSPNGRLVAYIDKDSGTAGSTLAITEVAPDGMTLGNLRARINGPSDRRMIRPTWRSDSRALAFCSDYQQDPRRENWDVYGVVLPAPSGSSGDTPLALTMDQPPVRKLTPDQKDFSSIWPALSPDGRWVAYSTKDATKPNARYALQLARIDPETMTPTGETRPIAADDNDHVWVSWYEDLFPPCVRIELIPTDSYAANVVKVCAYDDTPTLGTGRASFSASGRHFTKGMNKELVASGIPAAAASVVGGAGVTAVALTTAPMVDLPLATDPMPSYLGVLFSKSMTYDNKDAGKKKVQSLATLTEKGTGTNPYNGVEGFYVNQNVRLLIKVCAKDNQYRRSYPSPTQFNRPPGGGEPLSQDDDLPWVLPADDARAMAPTAQAPYLPLVRRADAQAGKPGVCWWWEDNNFRALDGGTNTTEFITRFGNFDGDELAAKPKLVYFHVVANDLWKNTTEVVIPVFIHNREVHVDKISGSNHRK